MMLKTLTANKKSSFIILFLYTKNANLKNKRTHMVLQTKRLLSILTHDFSLKSHNDKIPNLNKNV